MSTRQRTISLNGLWYFQESIFANKKYSINDWLPVRVPACWNTYAPHLAVYEGRAYFYRTFTAPPAERFFLNFEAVNYRCRVFVNGQEAGAHEGGYTPFSLEITSAIKRNGANELLVEVDNSRHDMLIPAQYHGWFNYGGIYRDVSLVACDRTFIKNVRVKAEPVDIKDGRAAYAELKITPYVEGETRGMEISCAVYEELAQYPAAQKTAGNVRPLQMRLDNPLLWSCKKPCLYKLVVELRHSGKLLDRFETPFGVRKLEFAKNGFVLNGEKIFLKGINRHDDYPTTKRTVDEEVLKLDFALLKELGVNALRLAHYPHDRRVIRMCEKNGILAWSEIPIYWKVQPDKKALRLAVDMAREMVARDWNSPAVVFWGVYNEIPSNEKKYAPFIKKIASHIRKLDETRLVTAASSTIYGKDKTDLCARFLDVVGVNIYPAWYMTQGVKARARKGGFDVESLDLGHFVAALEIVRKRLKSPYVLSEFGAEGILGYRAKDMPKYSEDYQTHSLKRQFEVICNTRGIAGTFVWLFADFPDPSREISCFHAERNCKGVVDYGRRKKAAFEALREIYAKSL